MTEDEFRVFARAAERIAEERSMERIASTFHTAAAAVAKGYDSDDVFGPPIGPAVAGDYTPPHAMRLLPDFTTRSRRLLENLQASLQPITTVANGEQKSMQKKVNFLNVL